MTIRVVLADDEPLVRSGIAMLLSADAGIEVVAEVGDGREAVEAVARFQPDVVVMDVRMPRMDGVEATRQITDLKGAGASVAVLMLTTYNLDEAIYSALCAGASGFLLKDAAPAELLAAIRALAGGEGWLDPGVTRSLIKEFAARTGTDTTPRHLLELRDPTAPTPAPAEAIFRREGEYWTIVFDGQKVHLKDSVGLAYLATLLKNPGQEVHALELGSSQPSSGDAGPLLDEEAKRTYRRRIQDLQEELDEAERWSDAARASRLREELSVLAGELARSVGLGGRDRVAASAAERARVNVTKSLKAAIRRIEKDHPALGRHLDNSIRTGTFCSYFPEPPAKTWRF